LRGPIAIKAQGNPQELIVGPHPWFQDPGLSFYAVAALALLRVDT
jgi:hypothetical protein